MIALEWIRQASASLRGSGIDTARLDAMILLGYITKTPREDLLAHMDRSIKWRSYRKLQKALKKREHRYPVAYITSYKEFYGLNFRVTPDVLIPRPESETLVELAIKHAPKNTKLIDIGTGSGCIASAIAKHRPDLDVTASDISAKALLVAKRNASTLGTRINLIKSDLFKNLEGQYDCVVANLPYVPDTAKTSPETAFEPFYALYGGKDGLDIYRAFFAQVRSHLSTSGLVIVEAEPNQHNELKRIAQKNGFKHFARRHYALACH